MFIVEGTEDTETGFVQDVGVNHRGGNVFVSEQFLHGANIGPAFEQVSGEAVPKSMTTGSFGQARGANGVLDGVLQVLFADMVATNFAGTGVGGKFGGGKDVLPSPGAIGVGVFSRKRVGEMDGAAAEGNILAMGSANALEMKLERRFQASREHGAAFAHAFALANDDQVISEIDIFDA